MSATQLIEFIGEATILGAPFVLALLLVVIVSWLEGRFAGIEVMRVPMPLVLAVVLHAVAFAAAPAMLHTAGNALIAYWIGCACSTEGARAAAKADRRRLS